MEKPIIVLNFKAYNESRGEGCSRLLDACKDSNLEIISCLPHLELGKAVEGMNIFAQHFDPVESGAHTGSITITCLKNAGVAGSLLNHSEKRIGMKNIKKSIELAKKHGLKIVCCVENLEEARQVLEMGPDMIAYEDKDLIGSGKSIADYQPEKIREFAALVGDRSIPLAGAGISNERDVAKALELGMKGVLIASAFVKSDDPAGLLDRISNELTSSN